jgi:RNA polymerase sigma factor (sigma-70 family)
MLIIYFFLLPFILGSKFHPNLSIYQLNLISSILKYPKIPITMRSTINNILYNKYESWAIHKAYEFKRFHKYKCRNLNVNDLILFSLEGLKKATLKYNGKSSFNKYANIYISGQLYKGLTQLQPITNIPKSIRNKKKSEIKTNGNYQYKKKLNTLFVSYDENWMFEKRQDLTYDENPIITKESHTELWNYINSLLDPFSKRVFTYKYDYYFNIINSNKKIGDLIGCSEETIRQSLKKTNRILNNNNTLVYVR